MYRLPLFDHTVLDLTTTAAGAYTTRLLGDLGAEVIMLESAERGSHEDIYVNKYSASASLTRDLVQFAATFDIVVYDGATALDYVSLHTANERVIAISLPADSNAGTAVAAAGAVGLALWDQRRTGRGGLVELPSPVRAAAVSAPEAGVFEPVSAAHGVREVRSPHWHLSETPLHVRLPAPRVGEHDEYVAQMLGESSVSVDS